MLRSQLNRRENHFAIPRVRVFADFFFHFFFLFFSIRTLHKFYCFICPYTWTSTSPPSDVETHVRSGRQTRGLDLVPPPPPPPSTLRAVYNNARGTKYFATYARAHSYTYIYIYIYVRHAHGAKDLVSPSFVFLVLRRICIPSPDCVP